MGSWLYQKTLSNAKSLVRRTESGRYDLHEVIRQYTSSNLNHHPSSSETYARHSHYYLAMLQNQGPFLKSASQQETVRQLTNEVDNIYAAWAWGIDNKKFDQLGQAGRAFGWYFEIAGMYQEGIDQLEMLVQALKRSPQANQSDRFFGLDDALARPAPTPGPGEGVQCAEPGVCDGGLCAADQMPVAILGVGLPDGPIVSVMKQSPHVLEPVRER